MPAYLDAVIGDDVSRARRRDIEIVLGYVFQAALVNVTSGRRTEKEVREVLRTAARQLLR
jgi:hypothetical protein